VSEAAKDGSHYITALDGIVDISTHFFRREPRSHFITALDGIVDISAYRAAIS
jgi:hypothetical protein